MPLLLPSHRILDVRRFVLPGFYPTSSTPLLASICSSPCLLPGLAPHTHERPRSYRLRVQCPPGSMQPRKPHWLALACGVCLPQCFPLPRQALASTYQVLHAELCAPHPGPPPPVQSTPPRRSARQH